MKKLLPLLFLSFFITSYSHASEGITSVASNHSVKETADRFVDILSKKGLTLFARVNHQKNAKSVDLELRETEVLIFGNPKVGTPLMQCEQQVAIDLPQKVLIAKDANGKVRLSYNNPEYIKLRHQVTECDAVFSKVANVLKALTSAAAK